MIQNTVSQPTAPLMLKVCTFCGAKYDATIQFWFGRYYGTSTQFEAIGKIPLGVCPVCRRMEVKGCEQ